MKNASLYIKAPIETQQSSIKCEHKPCHKANRSEVPPLYRRNRKKEFIDFLLMLPTAALFAALILWMFLYA